MPEIIDLDDSSDDEIKIKAEPPSCPTVIPSCERRPKIKREPGIKAEVIDFDDVPDMPIRSAAAIKVEGQAQPTPDAKNKARLEKLERERKKLAKEIEEAERLAEMKRKMEALEAEIEAARDD